MPASGKPRSRNAVVLPGLKPRPSPSAPAPLWNSLHNPVSTENNTLESLHPTGLQSWSATLSDGLDECIGLLASSEFPTGVAGPLGMKPEDRAPAF